MPRTSERQATELPNTREMAISGIPMTRAAKAVNRIGIHCPTACQPGFEPSARPRAVIEKRVETY